MAELVKVRFPQMAAAERLAAKLIFATVERGATVEEAAMGVLAAVVAVAAAAEGRAEGIEWARTAIDRIERQLLDRMPPARIG